ncbi:MAG: ABC transporter substrate-binding protein [Desulfobacterales bacterium]|nr:ABC transporter substrate-binding protein [Desulfobacterales bacterium]MCP4159278.1 ABC transporter substrate-binding protein [Deltaproteobacteria bacterium]
MDSKKKLIIIVSALVVCLIAGFFVYKSKQGDIRYTTLITAFTEMPQTLNPVFDQNSTGLILVNAVFDGITNRSGIRKDDFRFGIANDLAQDENNPKLYTIEINTDLKWHDYTEENKHTVSAKDVRFTYECIMEKENNSPLRARMSKLIDRLEVESDSEIKIYFKEAISPNKVGWLLPFKIIPRTYFGKAMSTNLRTDTVAQDFAKMPIGSGRYKMEEWKGGTILLSSFAKVAVEIEGEEVTVVKGKKVERIQATLVQDVQKQSKMLIDGTIDLVFDSDPDLHKMLDEKGLKHENYVPLHFYALAFNTTKEPFDDKMIRRAVSMSIDKGEVTKQLIPENHQGYVNYGPFPHNDDKRYKQFKRYLKHDVNKARKILDDFGSFTATLIYPEEEAGRMQRVAAKITQMASDVGIKINSKAIGLAYKTQLQQKNYELALVKHSGFSDGYNIASLYTSNNPQNITGLALPKLDKVLDKWQNTAFWDERLPLAKIVHKQILNHSPYVYLFSLPTSAYYTPRLTNVKITDPAALLSSVHTWRFAE